MNRLFACLIVIACGVFVPSSSDAQSLTTRWPKDLDRAKPLPEYPRPQLVREKWLSLNGEWDFAIRPIESAQPASGQFDGRILVPFAIESTLSGVKKPVGSQNRLWYRRSFDIPKDWDANRVVLHFGAVDWESTVYVNGRKMGEHRGGYDPFSVDITEALNADGKQELVVSVWDPTDSQSQPRGKQIGRPHGIWYTAVTGIWQTVWLEGVPPNSIKTLHISSRLDAGMQSGTALVKVATSNAQEKTIRATVLDGGRVVGSGEMPKGSDQLAIELKPVKLWSPESPFLYDIRVELLDGNTVVDSVGSYFGMRTIEVKKDAAGFNRMFLNGQALFQFGPLDQGWWPDGLYTAPTDEALRYDIEITRKLGFNMCRKHVKVEPDRWYYWADRLGLLVWQDMPSGMTTGQPHGIRPGAAQDAVFTDEQKKIYRTEWQAIMDALRNHPSIVVWVPFNEGWGQHDTNEILQWTKKYDPTRFVDGPSGWQDRGFGDLKDMHKYPAPGMFPPEDNRVSVLGEFGGLGLPIEGHTWLNRDNWGYRTYQSKDELLRQYERLIQQLPPLISEGLAAAVYTQTTDVEVEVNGLLTYDRAVIKMPVERLAKLHERLYQPTGKRSVLIPTSEKEPQSWRYTTVAPQDGWQKMDFDDSSWMQGQGGFGTSGTPGTRVNTTWNTPDIWMRRTIEIPNVGSDDIFLRIHHDEDAEVYLNGERIDNFTGYVTDYFDSPLSEAARKLIRSGPNVIAIHCKQTGGGQYIDAGFVRWTSAK